MSESELWTVAEVAEYLRLNPETVRRWIREGRLEAVKLGNGPKAPLRIDGAEVARVAGR